MGEKGSKIGVMEILQVTNWWVQTSGIMPIPEVAFAFLKIKKLFFILPRKGPGAFQGGVVGKGASCSTVDGHFFLLQHSIPTPS